jgi:hypothetical protein
VNDVRVELAEQGDRGIGGDLSNRDVSRWLLLAHGCHLTVRASDEALTVVEGQKQSPTAGSTVFQRPIVPWRVIGASGLIANDLC